MKRFIPGTLTVTIAQGDRFQLIYRAPSGELTVVGGPDTAGAIRRQRVWAQQRRGVWEPALQRIDPLHGLDGMIYVVVYAPQDEPITVLSAWSKPDEAMADLKMIAGDNPAYSDYLNIFPVSLDPEEEEQ